MNKAQLLAVLLTCAATTAALAQPSQQYGLPNGTQVQAPGYFFLVEPGEPVITVSTVGALPATGFFTIGQGATAADVVTAAGGAGVDRSGNASVRVYRNGGMVSESTFRDLFSNPASLVPLQDGDVVEVVGLISSIPGYYVHTEPGESPIEVTVSGAFTAPGRYRLDPETSVGDLVAFAGGLGVSGVRDGQSDIEATVRVFRSGSAIFEVPLEELYAQPELELIEDDVVDLEVVVRRRQSFWRDALSVTTTVLSLIILVDRVAR